VPNATWAILGVGDVAIVYDPSNYASNLIQQAEAIKQTANDAIMIANQAKQLEHEVQGLIYQAQDLVTNPLHQLEQIAGLWDHYNQVLAQVEGMTFALTQSAAQFEAAYPGTLGTTGDEIQATAASLLTQIRQESKAAVQSQSVYERLCEQQRLSRLALASAEQAQGNLQVQQANAQLLGIQSEQLAALAQVEAANGRMQATWVMKQTQEEAQGRASQEQWMRGFGAAGFRGVKEGQGVALP